MHAQVDMEPQFRQVYLAWLVSLVLHVVVIFHLLNISLPEPIQQTAISVSIKKVENPPEHELIKKGEAAQSESEISKTQKNVKENPENNFLGIAPLKGGKEQKTVPLNLDYKIQSTISNSVVDAEQLNGGTIFDPRLRQRFNDVETSNSQSGQTWQFNGQLYYHLGGNACLREIQGGYGIEDRHSEEFLLYNVRKVACHPEAEEGVQIIQALKAALKSVEK